MDCTLIINPGSSSKKYAIYNGNKLLLTIKYEKTVDGLAECIQRNKEQQKCIDVPIVDYDNALSLALAMAIDMGVVSDLSFVKQVGVRIVAPDKFFFEHKLIDDELVEKLRYTEDKAPLHIPPILSEIEAVKGELPDARLIAVSDSAFHNTIPSHIRRYSLKDAGEMGIQKFGYHGLSFESVSRRLEKVVGSSSDKTVVLHIGNGVSITGLREGKSIYTSMGYTPASGVLMGSRAGDIDPGALIAVLEQKGLSGEKAQEYIQTKGGFLGLTGVRDIRSVLDKEANKDKVAHEAIELFTLQLAQAVAKACVSTEGLSAIVFTGTAGERSSDLRSRILGHLTWLGIELDEPANESVYSVTQVISRSSSEVVVAVIPTDEMGEMARVCQEFK